MLHSFEQEIDTLLLHVNHQRMKGTFQNLYKSPLDNTTGDYMFGLGTQEIVLILIILLLLFGANKLPELARSLGVSVREFKKAVKEIEEPEE